MDIRTAQKRAAIEAVANHFGGRWEKGAGGGRDHLVIAGKRIALEVASLGTSGAGHHGIAAPRLRFDRVAKEFVARLRSALTLSVPDGLTVIFTITAPLRMASRTAEALERRIDASLARGKTDKFAETIEANRIRVRIVKSGTHCGSNVIGYVHNPDAGADVLLLDFAQALLERFGAAVKPPKQSWLVLVVAHAFVPIETYRRIFAELSPPANFSRILAVYPGGRVADLTE